MFLSIKAEYWLCRRSLSHSQHSVKHVLSPQNRDIKICLIYDIVFSIGERYENIIHLIQRQLILCELEIQRCECIRQQCF